MDPQIQQIMLRLQTLENNVDGLQSNQIDPNHYHNGFDTNNVQYSDLAGVTFIVRQSVYGADAQTAANFGVLFIAPFACYVSAMYEVHGTAGTDAGAVSLNIEKLTGSQVQGSGVNVLSADVSLKATKNVVQSGSLSLTKTNTNLAKGDRLALKKTGTLTSLADVCVTLLLTVI